MERRTEPLSPELRSTLRRRAIGAAILAVPMLAAVTFMVWVVAAPLLPISGRALFYTFFVGILLFIVGSHVRNALDKDVLVITGVVTDKQTHTSSSMNRSSTSSTNTTWTIALDGTEQRADHATFQAVAKGQKVELWTSPSTGTVHRVVVLEGALPARDETPGLPTAPEDGYLRDEHRGVLWGRLGWAIAARGLGGAALAGALYVVLVIVALLALDDVLGKATGPVVLYVAPALAFALWLAINRHTARIAGDLVDGRTIEYREVVRDVVRSNTTMLGPNATLTGPGLSGPFTYVQTDHRWVAIDPAAAQGVAAGSTVRVVTTARASIVVDVRPL